jgi:HAD superfamily hydrolase (TIGR01509 family)
MITPMIKALIFDFDGLILETEWPAFQAWKELFESFNCLLTYEQWQTTIGTMPPPFDPFDLLEGQLGYPLERDEIAEKRLTRELELIAAQPLMPGVQTYLSDAQRLGLKLALASSSDCTWVTDHLQERGLIDYFDCIRARDDVHRTKPDPGLYLAALDCLVVRPDHAIALEDSEHGVTAAKRAGLHCVAVPTHMTRSMCFDHADLILNSLEDMALEDLIHKFD